MTERLTAEQLKNLRRLLGECTQGEWDWLVHDYSMASLGVMPDPGMGDPLVLNVSPCKACQDNAPRDENGVHEWEWGRCNTPSEVDAQLIAKSKNALPALLDAAEENARLREALEDIREESIKSLRSDSIPAINVVGLMGLIAKTALDAAAKVSK